MIPYEECIDCIAKNFCKRYAGIVEKPKYPEWCNVKFRLYKALELANIPPEYFSANIYFFDIDEYNKDNLIKIRNYLNNIVDFVRSGYNAFFYGSTPGTGKTYAASMFLNHYIYKTCLTDKFDFENPLALFVDYTELMDELRYSRDEEYLNEKLEMIKNVPLLLLDDVGAGTITDFVREQTFMLINYRFNHKLSTLLTTNYSINELSKDTLLGKRIVSRILNKCIGFEFTGIDRRVGKV
jgi:DNA replication protein DnaC